MSRDALGYLVQEDFDWSLCPSRTGWGFLGWDQALTTSSLGRNASGTDRLEGRLELGTNMLSRVLYHRRGFRTSTSKCENGFQCSRMSEKADDPWNVRHTH